MGGVSSMHRREMNEEFRWGSLKEKRTFGRPSGKSDNFF